MKSKMKRLLLATFILGFFSVISVPNHVQALIPSNQQYVRFLFSDGSFAYFYPTNEAYVKDTLPNEWIASWPIRAVRAGAVIIRSGAYWRTNRSILQSGYPYNNCYYGAAGGYPWYVKAPYQDPITHQNLGGHEQYIPGSAQTRTNAATDSTLRYHAETVALGNRPDKLVTLLYNSTIQTRTRDGSGSWTARIRYAYNGPGHPTVPYNPNKECGEEIPISDTDPVYPNS